MNFGALFDLWTLVFISSKISLPIVVKWSFDSSTSCLVDGFFSTFFIALYWFSFRLFSFLLKNSSFFSFLALYFSAVYLFLFVSFGPLLVHRTIEVHLFQYTNIIFQSFKIEMFSASPSLELWYKSADLSRKLLLVLEW